MFQTNSPELLALRWSFDETVTAPGTEGNQGESKSTYQYTPAQLYGSKDELGWVGPHFTYYVETTFKGTDVLKDALTFGNAYELTDNLHFPIAGCSTNNLVGGVTLTGITGEESFNTILTEKLPALLANDKNGTVTPKAKASRELRKRYIGIYGTD